MSQNWLELYADGIALRRSSWNSTSFLRFVPRQSYGRKLFQATDSDAAKSMFRALYT